MFFYPENVTVKGKVLYVEIDEESYLSYSIVLFELMRMPSVVRELLELNSVRAINLAYSLSN